jgi:hypothetical protein
VRLVAAGGPGDHAARLVGVVAAGVGEDGVEQGPTDAQHGSEGTHRRLRTDA